MTDTWTLEEAAQLLDPPMSVEQLRHLVQAAGLQPAGARRTGRRGRPAPTYSSTALLRAHAAIAPLLVRAENT
jgi:hypothetical protein